MLFPPKVVLSWKSCSPIWVKKKKKKILTNSLEIINNTVSRRYDVILAFWKEINVTFQWASKTGNYLSLPQFKQIFPKVDLFIFDWRHSQVKDEKWTRPSRRLLVDSHQKFRAAPTSWLGLIQIDYCAFCDNYWLHCHVGLLLWCFPHSAHTHWSCSVSQTPLWAPVAQMTAGCSGNQLSRRRLDHDMMGKEVWRRLTRSWWYPQGTA